MRKHHWGLHFVKRVISFCLSVLLVLSSVLNLFCPIIAYAVTSADFNVECIQSDWTHNGALIDGNNIIMSGQQLDGDC